MNLSIHINGDKAIINGVPYTKDYINPSERKLAPAAVRRIRTNAEGMTQRAWAKHYNVSQGVISKAVLRHTYRDVV